MSKKLAIFVHSLAGGGAERAMLNLTHGFHDRGIPVDLVLLRREGQYLPKVNPQVRVWDLGGGKLIFSLDKLVHYLRSQQPHAFLSTMDDTNIAATWTRKLAGVPTRLVVNVQNTITQDARNAKDLKTRLMPPASRVFLPWADAITTVSQGVADDLKQIGIPDRYINVVHNPVVTPDLFARANEPVDHPWFAPGQPPVIVTVGRLHYQKDHWTLLRAFHHVQKHLNVRLMILGEGRDRAQTEQWIEQLGLSDRVALPGFVENPFAYVKQSALFVLSSIFEGLPTVLIEAIAVGTPVVSTDCPSGPREILDHGLYGPLVSVGDVDGLAEAMMQTLQRPIAPEILRQRAMEYSLDKSLDRYAQLLDIA